MSPTQGAALREDDAAWRTEVHALVEAYIDHELPRSALRVLERCLRAQPVDADYRTRYEEVADRHAIEPVVERRLGVVQSLEAVEGDRGLWEPLGHVLRVRCHDRAEDAELRGLYSLRTPYRVSAKVTFGLGDPLESSLGFTFGARDAFSPGDWGVFAQPNGRVRFAQQHHLEWTSDTIGLGPRGSLELRVDVDATHVEPFVDGRSLGRRELAGRAVDGWLGLHARRVEARLEDVVVATPPASGPPPWYTLGRR